MDDAIERLYEAIAQGELREEDLSTRRIAAFLDRTTGAVYHRWGSLDGVLFAVSQRGFAALAERLLATWEGAHELAACAEVFVTFGLDQPVLYGLMLGHPYDWGALRASGAFAGPTPGSALLAQIVCVLREAGSASPMEDTRMLMAGLHGIVSFAASGRMNAGELTASDRDVALTTARALARRLLPATTTSGRRTAPAKKQRKKR